MHSEQYNSCRLGRKETRARKGAKVKLAWSHAFLNVGDLQGMVNFYTQFLGFEVQDRTDRVVFLSQQDDEHHQIALSAVDRLPDARSSRVNHFAFRLNRFDELMELYRRLKGRSDQHRIVPVTHGNTWSLYFHDPEGNGLEVFCDTPWEIRQPYAEPWDPEQGFEELCRTTKEQIRDLPGFGPNSRRTRDD